MTSSTAELKENKSPDDQKVAKIQAAYSFYSRHYLSAEAASASVDSILNSSGFKDFFPKYETAHDFYVQSKYEVTSISSHLEGIDFTKDVRLTPLEAGAKRLYQFQAPGDLKVAPTRQGDYYAEGGASPTSLGISPQATRHWLGEKDPIDKNLHEYKITSTTIALETTARAILDTWSVPGAKIQTEGGGIQYFCAAKKSFEFAQYLTLDAVSSLRAAEPEIQDRQKVDFSPRGMA